MMRRPVVVSPVNATLATRGLGGQRLARLDAEAVDDVDDAGRQQVGRSARPAAGSSRGLLGRLEHDAVAGGQRGRELPRGHEQREVPRDDLADHAERLVEVVGDGVVVELGEACPPGRGCSRRSSGSGRSASGRSAASVSRTGLPLSQVSATASFSRFASMRVGDLVEQAGPLGGRGLAPPVRRRRVRRSSASSTSSALERATSREASARSPGSGSRSSAP